VRQAFLHYLFMHLRAPTRCSRRNGMTS